MIFPDNGLSVFIDPSYTCTGIWAVVPSRKQGKFRGVSDPASKRTLQGYWSCALNMARDFSHAVGNLPAEFSVFRGSSFDPVPEADRFEPGSVTVVMEAPFPRGLGSPGLYGLQFLYLERLQGMAAVSDVPFRFYSLSPSYISAQFKRECGKDSPRVRKEWVASKCDALLHDGWQIDSLQSLKRAGCDRQTAFGFWWFLSHSDKELEPFELDREWDLDFSRFG